MDCREARRALSARMDGELGSEREADLAEHLRGCADCAEAEKRWIAVRGGFEELPRETAPHGTVAGVLDRIRAARERARSTTPFVRRVAIAASVLLVVTTALVVTTPASRAAEPSAADADIPAEVGISFMMSEVVSEHAPSVELEEEDR